MMLARVADSLYWIGRYIERAQLVSRLLGIHFGASAADFALAPQATKYLDWLVLLKFCSAFEPYCKEHTAALRPERVAEFLLFDPEFPHSVKFAVGRVHESLAHVALGAPPQRRAACERLAGRLKAAIDFGQVDELMGSSFAPFLAEIMPFRVRTAGFSLAFSLATALFGGFTPAVSTYLIHATGNPAMPALWLGLAAALALGAALPASRVVEDAPVQAKA